MYFLVFTLHYIYIYYTLINNNFQKTYQRQLMNVYKLISRFSRLINNKVQYFEYVQGLRKSAIISPQLFKQIVELDRKFDCINFNRNIQIFKQYLKGNYYLNQQSPFYGTLLGLSKFQKVELESQYIEYIYWLINNNIHNLDSKSLVSAYLFLSKSDPLIHQSILYEYFVKYYVKNSSELLKIQFKVNSSMNIGQMIKKIFSRLLIKQYGKKTPSYEKTIGVPKTFKVQLLQELLKNKNTSESLFAKKLHYELFMEIKDIYQDQMKQNLYHTKSQQLFTLIQSSLSIWIYEIEIIKEQNILIRELYMKLLLASQGKLCHLYTNNLFNFYELLITKYDQKQEDILKVISYIKNHFIKQYERVFLELNFSNKIKFINTFLVSQEVISSYCFQKIKESVSSYHTHIYLTDIIKLKANHTHLFQIYLSGKILTTLELLSLDQLITFSFEYLCSKEKLAILLDTIINLQSATVITSQNILNLLQIISSDLVQKQLQTPRQILRDFIFKYISDHHREFPIETYLQIYQLILKMKDSKKSFDSSGFYKENIFEQLKQYNQQKNIEEKILILASQKKEREKMNEI